MEDQRVLLAKMHSEQFQSAFERCWNTNRQYDLLPDGSLGMPALICATLSVEVGIKALLAAQGIKPQREHNLRRLMEALPASTKSAIVDEVSSVYQDFEAQLTNAEDAFVRWRYFYESKGEININILFVGALGAAVQRQLGLRWVAA